MFKKYQKGRRIYTTLDGRSEQVTVLSKKLKEEEPLPVQVEVPPALVNGKPSNLFMIYHNREEFVIDLCFLPPGQTKAKVTERIIMSPVHAKRFMKTLERSVS